MRICKWFWRKGNPPTPQMEPPCTDSNAIYLAVVNDRVLRLRHEVMREFDNLGFGIYTSSGFLHEATIRMAEEINRTPDDEEAKRRIRPIIKEWVLPNHY